MRNLTTFIFGLSISCSFISTTANAQTQASVIEEITVTAQQREQSILDVPVTMDVISGDFLDRTSTTELDDLSRFLPNVVIQEQGVSLPSFNIRGITDDSASVTTTPRISVYQDGIDISKKTVSSVGLYDVERIEVLKGAQPTLFGTFTASAERDFSATLPRVALNYAYNDNLSLYFNYAEGRRSPVVDANPFGETSVVAPETVDSYDIGFKYYGSQLSFTAALFAYTYQNYQESFTDFQTFESVTVTVGDSDMYGFESSVDYIFDDSLRLGANLGLLDAEFAGSTETGARFDYGGNTFRLAPEVSGALFLNKSFVFNGYDLELELISSYQSEIFFDSSNRPELKQDAYWISDAAIKFGNGDSFWRVEVYADNIFDEEYLIDAGNTGGGFGIPTFVAGMPFIAGVRLYADY
jgi:iron complex outermembrane receptor protein